jgi:hypothetical protein
LNTLPEFVIIYSYDVLLLRAMLLKFLLQLLCYFVLNGGRCCRRDVDAVIEVDLSFIAVGDNWRVVRLVLFNLARRQG